MMRLFITTLLMAVTLGVAAQSRVTKSTKRGAAVKTTAKCAECKGKGYVLCPKCKGKIEVYGAEDEEMGILCDACCVEEDVVILTSSSIAFRLLQNSNVGTGNVKCPYCTTKTRKKYMKISKERYEKLKKE